MTKLQERWTNQMVIENITNEDGNPTGGSVKGILRRLLWLRRI